jgi:hypothetical protein
MKTWMSIALLLASCAERREASAPATMAPPAPPMAEPAARAEDMKAEVAPASPQQPAVRKPRSSPAEEASDDDHGGGAESRAWFPETFLFEPLVVTDAEGRARVSVRVPDRLTTWRVLALAHSREGAQGGAVARFLGTLPAYVEPVVPPFLMTGDEVRLPIQVVNTTDAPLDAELRLSAEGATVAPTRATVSVPPGGSLVQTVTLSRARPGTLTLRAALGQTDAVVRTIPVLPSGRRVTLSRSGTLAAPRTLELEGPAAADPASAEARLTVFPGALGLLRTELAGSRLRGGAAEDAYTLLLAGSADRLLGAFGDRAEPDAVRELTLVAAQRVVRHARTLDVARAALLAPAALAHPGNPVLARLGERAVAQLARDQRPDGTFAGGDGWTLQRLLVVTAEATRAVQAGATTDDGRRRAAGVALRAQAAFERQLAHVDDGYTAAALLASGAISGELAERLRARVRAAIEPGAAGARVLGVEPGVTRADGETPSVVEATALAVLALAGDPDVAMLADLGTTLLASYDPRHGWGDGRTNLACLAAVLALFDEPVPPGVKVTLSVDGVALADGVLDGARLRDVLVLAVPAPVGRHEWRIEASPPVPGLAYAFTLTGHVPWQRQPPRGLELAIAVPGDLRAGTPATVVVSAVAPSGTPLRVQQALPAGVQVDRVSLEKLVEDGTLASWRAVDGNLDLEVPPLDPGETVRLAYRVIPTLAGKLSAGASRLEAAGELFELPSAMWMVR